MISPYAMPTPLVHKIYRDQRHGMTKRMHGVKRTQKVGPGTWGYGILPPQVIDGYDLALSTSLRARRGLCRGRLHFSLP